jgi:hypothetical protein
MLQFKGGSKVHILMLSGAEDLRFGFICFVI